MSYVICDVDGTISDCQKRAERYLAPGEKKNWDAFHEACDRDEPVEHVVTLVRALSHVYGVVFVTGRPERMMGATRTWLSRHVGLSKPSGLVMRKDGDHRPDEVVKQELYEERVLPQQLESPVLVIDDRPVVIRMWKSLGLPVVQVGRSIGQGGDF